MSEQIQYGDHRVDHSIYERQEYFINGCRTVVYVAGKGKPLVYLHGGGTWHGLTFAQDWLSDFQVILPYHPGFGHSDDNSLISSMEGYVDHYVELFNAMGLDKVMLVGFSLGGRLAAEFAALHPHFIEKLVLVAPAGLNVPEHPQPDFTQIKPSEIPGYLVEDISVIAPYLPTQEDPEFSAMRMREGGSVAKILRNGSMVNKSMPTILGRITMPVLLIWGTKDRIVPPGQANRWQQLIPGSELQIIDNAGHLVLDESQQARRSVISFCSQT